MVENVGLIGTDLLWVKIIITLASDLIHMTKTDDGVMTMKLKILEVINTLPLQETIDKIKLLIPDLTEGLISHTDILWETPLSITHS